ncbi:aminotransferase class I/II-fold pyridoxal phosphate-dependent enzyme [Dysgonomonas sp. Marseille-P4677]|uniref:pyridoxal phosphate-dependent aminotransferase n=1 Tax=Dysgonomonas sp. Marseille-P4677 TaxID=2364790 RepID=UPI00191482FE|nr:aminotransferase class I/II-fold pyridoxal phosphate-dependent enzyme [Dysgonomonas sp. Marseille-P4677]MBK5720247.1 aminotransferase class I/II-fold pyridoxal phosphate-dependent enzyme [Dysgonomonas sp. Marseille-P4677]
MNIIPADRLNTFSEYYFSTKLKEVAEMNAAGKNVISLGIGSPDLPPSEETVIALNESASKSDTHGYQPHVGIPELRKAFTDWYARWYGVKLDSAKEVQPLIGSKEGILHISLAFLNPGDGVLVPNPGYPTYTSVSKLVGATIQSYNLDENNDWQPDFEALEKMDLSKTKLMWVNYPNMPTGANGSLELFRKLVDFGKKHNIVIAHDNPYSLILNESPISILQIEGAKDICVELNSMSKSHNMPGWRIGMVASNPQFIQWILKVLSNIESGILKPMQLATVAALNNSDEWHKKNNIELYASRRQYAENIMTQLGCTFDKSQVGMFLWGRIPDHYKNSEELADKILYDANVFLTPGFIFGDKGDRYIRISLCCNEEMLREALQRIKKIQS